MLSKCSLILIFLITWASIVIEVNSTSFFRRVFRKKESEPAYIEEQKQEESSPEQYPPAQIVESEVIYQKESEITVEVKEGEEEEEGEEYESKRTTTVASIEDLRYLTFGTSRTLGRTMKDPSLAYPYLLSPTVTNKAMGGSDASYPSMCTETMVGNDEIYDVIIVEYDRPFECLDVLIRRLRKRFPDAIIVLMEMWNLQSAEVRFKQSGKRARFGDILKESGFHVISDEALDYALNLADTEIIFDSWLDARKRSLQEIAVKYNAHVYSWERHPEDVTQLLQYRFRFFSDIVHLNEYGHRIIANDLKKIIHKAGPVRSDDVGTWGDGDFCSSWLQTGVLKTRDDGSAVIRTPTSPMVLFDPIKQKYAIEIKYGSATIVIDNPFRSGPPRKLYFTYMTTYPNQIYPDTNVVFVGQHDARNITEIHPVSASYNYPVHVQQSQEIGVLKPGKNMIRITTMQESEKPFRLVGFAITNGEFNPTSLYFRPERVE